MRDPATIIVASPEEFEQAYTLVVPLEWEQQYKEVRYAIVCHRWACLKLRQLTREQGAIDWGATTEKKIWEWSRRIGTAVFRLMVGLPP